MPTNSLSDGEEGLTDRAERYLAASASPLLARSFATPGTYAVGPLAGITNWVRRAKKFYKIRIFTSGPSWGEDKEAPEIHEGTGAG